MKITKMNNGFYKLGDDEYRVEAPMKYPNKTRMEDFTDASGRKRQRMVTLEVGEKLRSNVSLKDADGNFTEPEPTVWHLYEMTKFELDGAEQIGLNTLDDNFIGTAKEAIAACEAHKAGG